MRVFGLLFILSINLFAFAQFKEYKKLDDLFAKKDYDKCIEQSYKYYKKEPKELMPVLFYIKANYELYKTADDENSKLRFLKKSLTFAGKIDNIDKNGEAKDRYSDYLNELHKAVVSYADTLYLGEEKSKSKVLYDNLARIYNDTMSQFYEFHPELRKKEITSVGINAVEEKVNQIDEKGRKQGFWKKVYPNGVVAYEVYFKDDKRVGVHKRYHENGKLMAILEFDEKGEWADAKLYNEEEKLVAVGKYQNKLKQGAWTYYKDSIKVAEENFVDGKKHGISRTFYKNGKPSEEKHWNMDVEDGVWRQYFLSGKVKLEARIDKGIRNSGYYTYYQNGRYETKGQYKDDHMHGDWIYYNEKGNEIHRITYNMGKTDQQDILDEKENEYFKKLEQNKGRLKDPANYINNPNDYLKESGLN